MLSIPIFPRTMTRKPYHYGMDCNSRDNWRIPIDEEESAHYPDFFEFSEIVIVHTAFSEGYPPFFPTLPSAVKVNGNKTLSVGYITASNHWRSNGRSSKTFPWRIYRSWAAFQLPFSAPSSYFWIPPQLCGGLHRLKFGRIIWCYFPRVEEVRFAMRTFRE